MKILGIEDLDFSDFNELNVLAEQVIQEWTNEKKFFDSLIFNPDFDRPSYQELIKLTGVAHQHLTQLKHSFITPQNQAKVPESHPSRYDEQKKKQLLVEKIEAFMKIYQALYDYRVNHSSVGRLEEKFLDRITELEQSVLNNTQQRIEELTTTVREDIKQGITDLLNLKSELGLTKEFGGKIETELEAAKTKEFRFMLAFIGALVLIPVSVLATNSFTEGMTDAVSGYILKGSIAVSLLFVSLFFFSQYRTYMMIRLRYTHLDGFLGGGATFISQLLEADSPDLKLEVNKKLAEMFMSLDDVLKMVQKSKHPTELTLETAETVFDKVSKFRK